MVRPVGPTGLTGGTRRANFGCEQGERFGWGMLQRSDISHICQDLTEAVVQHSFLLLGTTGQPRTELRIQIVSNGGMNRGGRCHAMRVESREHACQGNSQEPVVIPKGGGAPVPNTDSCDRAISWKFLDDQSSHV
jgi:hypothetical protein